MNDSSCPPGHNTPLPLERSPPGSFKRLLGSTFPHLLLGPGEILLEAGEFALSIPTVGLAARPRTLCHDELKLLNHVLHLGDVSGGCAGILGGAGSERGEALLFCFPIAYELGGARHRLARSTTDEAGEPE